MTDRIAPGETRVKKPIIRVDFSDFWGDFIKTDNYFWNLLSTRYELVLSPDPDFLFYSSYSRNFTRYDCFRIFYTAENVRPDFRECDFAFSFDYLETPRNYRLPLYALYADNELLTRKRVDPDELMREKRKFCAFVVSNPVGKTRNEFFRKLSRYKRVDSAGRYLNNIGGSLPAAKEAKWEFLRPYKFTIAFENSSYPGYTTEKIFEPMLVNSLPIYWGNPLVDRDFNPASFLNYHEFPNEEALIERILELDALEVGDGIDGLQGIFNRLNGADQFPGDGRDQIGNMGKLVTGVTRQGFRLEPFFPDLVGYITSGSVVVRASVDDDLGVELDALHPAPGARAIAEPLGADAVAVMYLYSGPARVIDFGTATTFNALTKNGEYLGGAITAGINLAAEALSTHAAKLPNIDLQRPPSVIGRNTLHAMQSGLIFGYVSMVEGMVARFRSELGSDMKVVATGGLVEIVARETGVIQHIAPWLTLDGLRILWDLNHPI